MLTDNEIQLEWCFFRTNCRMRLWSRRKPHKPFTERGGDLHEKRTHPQRLELCKYDPRLKRETQHRETR
ncbi:50S ribosomal protein L33 [Cohnella sp. REN36]|uniref:50S ribosomal protein L33 n=1 Tax=Cohnella sp. REN36 TaxID=2887347 RepID=UPI00351D42D0